MTVPSFVYKTLPTSTDTPFTNYLFQELGLTHVLFGIITLLCVIIVILAFPKCKKSDNHTYLVIEITNGSSCVTIPLTKLPLCPSYWEFNMPTSIDYVEINGTFRRKIKLE